MRCVTQLVIVSTLLSILPISSDAGNEAVMYKKIDKNGNIIFTDKPLPGSKEVKVDTEKNVVETPKVKSTYQPRKNKQENQGALYSVLSIDSPKQGDTIINADGNVTMIVGITPKLQPTHQLQLKLNGSVYGAPQDTPYFNIKGLNPGNHSASVVLLEKNTQKELQSTPKVEFKLVQPSSRSQQ